MEHFEQTLQERITELAHSADKADAQRVLRRMHEQATPTRPHRKWGRRPLIFGAVGAAVAAAALFTLNGTGVIGEEANPAQTTTNASGPHIPNQAHGAPAPGTVSNSGTPGPGQVNHAPTWGPGQHCFGVKSVPVSKLTAIAKVPIWLPDNNVSAVTDSWKCGGTPQAGGVPVVMIGDVQISYEPGWADVDVPAKWHDLVDDYGGYTVMIAGHEALVQPGSIAHGTYNQIMIVHHGILVALLSKADVPMSTLLNDAKALNFNKPVTYQ